MQVNLIYKALTRTPTFVGVPLVPFMFAVTPVLLVGVVGAMLISMYFGLLWLLIPIIIVAMQKMAKSDDRVFELYGKSMFVRGTSAINKQKGDMIVIKTEQNKNKIDKRNDMVSVKSFNKSTFLSELLPYDWFYSDDIIVTKNMDFIISYRIKGIVAELKDDAFIDNARNSLNVFFRQFATGNTSFYFHCIRKNAVKNNLKNVKFNNSYLQELNDDYYDSMQGLKETFYTLEIVYSPFDSVKLKAYRKADNDSKIEMLNDIVAKLDDIDINLREMFSEYKVERLGRIDDYYSEQLTILNALIGGDFVRVDADFNEKISDYFVGNVDELLFGEDVVKIKKLDGSTKYCQIIELKDYNNATMAGIFDLLLYSNSDYIFTHIFVPKSTAKTIHEIELQQKRMVMQGDRGQSQVADLTNATDELVSGNLVFGDYNFILCVYGDSVADLKANVNEIIYQLSVKGFLATKANIALASTYLAQFPANFKYRTRTSLVSSLNFADMLGLHNFNSGQLENNQWGDAVTMLKTANGQPYYFNFHMETGKNDFKADVFNLGNTLILGSSGGGKTVLSSFLVAQLQKYGNKDSFAPGTPDDKKKQITFYLDKDKGAIGNIIACGGKYITIDRGQPTGFNPFMVDNTPENVRKLQVLIKRLVGRELTSKEEERLIKAINSVMAYDKASRRYGMSLLWSMLGEENDELNSVKSKIKNWTKQGSLGWVFDNDVDLLDFSNGHHTLYGIDGTDLLQDPDISEPTAFYILWRLMDLTDGRRFALFIDEAWDWIRNPVVADEVFNKEKTIRKQNGILILATQSVEDLSKSPIARALIEQSATILLLSNPQAKREDYVEALNMSEEDFEFVRDVNTASRLFLVRKNTGERTVVGLDLKAVGSDKLSILSTGTVFVDSIVDINKEPISDDEKYRKIQLLYKENK